MEAILSDFPLALFTTLAPLGAGAFLVLAIAFSKASFSAEEEKRIDKMTIVPIVIAIVGFCCTFAHVANPLKAYGLFAGVGSSPLTNEVLIGMVFMALAFIYLVCGLAGKLGGGRKPLAIVTAVVAAVFAVFMGTAYMISTVSSWATLLNSIEMLGYLFVGGAATGLLVLALAKVGTGATVEALKVPVLVLAVAGAILAIVAGIVHIAMVAGSGNAMTSGSAVAANAAPYLAVGLVVILIAVIETVRALGSELKTGTAVRISIEAAFGILLARCAFYALYLSVGITVM